MNKDFENIHTLCEEMLPFYDELGEKAKAIVDEHLKKCPICRAKNQDLTDLNHLLLTNEAETETQQFYKKFSKLNAIKISVFLITILLKAIVLTLIGKEFVNLATFTQAPLGLLDEGVRASMLIYYIPTSFLTLILGLILVKKRFAILVLVIDILLFIYYDDFLVKWVS